MHALVHVFTQSSQSKLFSGVIARFRAEEMPDRHSTRTAYESMLSKWIEPRWGNVPTADIRTADVELWLHEMNCAAKTRGHRRALMHALLNAAIRWELVDRNPVTLARVRGGTRRRRRPLLISLAELRSVLGHLETPFREMVLLAALMGLRASEVVALKWRDFDFCSKTLQIERGSVSGRIADTKTESSEDLLPLHEGLIEELFRYRASAPQSAEDWVFPSNVTGRPYHQDSIRKRRLIPAGEAAGLTRPLGWHTFRHSYRRWLDEAGTPVGIIKELMRHAHIATTMDVYGVGTLTAAKRQAHSAVAQTILKQSAA
jgi:integrase